MELLIVGKYSPGIRIGAAWVENHLGNLIGPQIASVRGAKSFETLVFFTTIIDPNIMTAPDHVTYKRNEPSVYVGINIPYEEWMAADRLRRAALFAEALSKGVRSIKASKISELDRDAILGGIERALATLREDFS